MWLLIENKNYHDRWNATLLFYLENNPDMPLLKQGMNLEQFFASKNISLEKFLEIFPDSIVKIIYGEEPEAEIFPKAGERIVWSNVCLIKTPEALQRLASLIGMPVKLYIAGNNILEEKYFSPDQRGELKVALIDADDYANCPRCGKHLPRFEHQGAFAGIFRCDACREIFVAKLDPWRYIE